MRHRKGASATAAAERLYPMARKLVDEAKAIGAAFRDPAKVATVTVGLMRALDVERTREVLTLFGATRDVKLRIVGEDETCDLRVVTRAMAHAKETFVPLWSERFVVAIPSSHPLALRATVRASDLAGERIVERCHCDHARHFARGKRRPVAVAVAASEEWAVALVSAGVGIAIIPEGSVRPDPRVVVRTIADVNVAREVGIAYRAKSPARALVEDVVRRFRGSLGSLRRREPRVRATVSSGRPNAAIE